MLLRLMMSNVASSVVWKAMATSPESPASMRVRMIGTVYFVVFFAKLAMNDVGAPRWAWRAATWRVMSRSRSKMPKLASATKIAWTPWRESQSSSALTRSMSNLRMRDLVAEPQSQNVQP